VAIEKTPERAAAGSNPLLAQLCNGLLKRQVWMLSNHSQDLGRELFKRRNAPAARLRRGAVIIAPALQPLDRRGYAHLKTFGRLAPRCARSHGFDNAYPQVTRIGLWHCPPPDCKENQCTKDSITANRLGIPRFKPGENRFRFAPLRSLPTYGANYGPGLAMRAGAIFNARGFAIERVLEPNYFCGVVSSSGVSKPTPA